MKRIEAWAIEPRFYKGHGHGNDYLVMPRGDAWVATAAAIRTLCDRWRGVGGDGVVFVDESTTPIRLRMFNPDGGEFERSGNGLRVAAASLYRRGTVGTDAFEVEVGGDRVEMRVRGVDASGRLDIEADMGVVRFGGEAVGLTGTEDLQGPDGAPLDATMVSVGNPHCVCFLDSVPEIFDALPTLGPWLATHTRFSSGTNVQLAHVADGQLHIGIWERGVGRTSSSGTSACAATAAAVNSGRLLPGEHVVQMEGGTFQITVDPQARVRLRGPVQSVMEGTLASEFVQVLSASPGTH